MFFSFHIIKMMINAISISIGKSKNLLFGDQTMGFHMETLLKITTKLGAAAIKETTEARDYWLGRQHLEPEPRLFRWSSALELSTNDSSLLMKEHEFIHIRSRTNKLLSKRRNIPITYLYLQYIMRERNNENKISMEAQQRRRKLLIFYFCSKN